MDISIDSMGVTLTTEVAPLDVKDRNSIEEQLNSDLLPVEKNKLKAVSIGKFAIETLRLGYK